MAKAKEPRERAADIRTVQKYAELLTEKMQVERELKLLNGKIADLTQPVLEYFQRQGIDQIAAGKRTLYLRREIQTSKVAGVSQDDACAYLRSIGLDDYAGSRVNTQGLGAWVREKETEGLSVEEIQEELGDSFRIVELYKIGSRAR